MERITLIDGSKWGEGLLFSLADKDLLREVRDQLGPCEPAVFWRAYEVKHRLKHNRHFFGVMNDLKAWGES